MAARITSSTTSPCAGPTGSGTFSTRTSCGPWKTAALTGSALDLDLDVATRVTRGLERRGSFAERERRRQERRRIDAARRHEPDGARPHPGGADDPSHLERFRLDKADLDGRGAADVYPYEHDARAERRNRKRARHGRRSAGGFDHHVEPASALLDLARIERVHGPDLEPECAAMGLRLDQRHRAAHRRC